MGFSNLFRYAHGDSFLHRLDPRVKMLGIIVLSLLVALFGSLWVLLGLWAVSLAAHLSAGIPWAKSKYLFYSYPFLVLVVAVSQGVFFWGEHERILLTIIDARGAFLGFAIPGVSGLLAKWPGPVGFYQEGFVYGLIQSLRAVTLLTAGLTVALTTHPVAMLFGLRKLWLPYEFCFIVTMAIRFLPQIMDDVKTVLDAQRARGLALRRFGPRDKLRTSQRLLQTVLITTLQRSRDTALAIDIRGFRAYPTRTFARERVLRASDLACLIGLLAAAALGVWLALSGHGAPPAYIYR